MRVQRTLIRASVIAALVWIIVALGREAQLNLLLPILLSI